MFELNAFIIIPTDSPKQMQSKYRRARVAGFLAMQCMLACLGLLIFSLAPPEAAVALVIFGAVILSACAALLTRRLVDPYGCLGSF